MPAGNRFPKIQTSLDSLVDFFVSVKRVRDEWQREDELKAKQCGEKSEPTQIWFRGQSKAGWPYAVQRRTRYGIDKLLFLPSEYFRHD